MIDTLNTHEIHQRVKRVVLSNPTQNSYPLAVYLRGEGYYSPNVAISVIENIIRQIREDKLMESIVNIQAGLPK